MAQQNDKEILNRYGYQLIQKVGTGSFSSVYEALHEKTGKKYAIKMMQPSDRNLQETQILKMLNHEHIISYIEHFTSTTHLFMVTEFCDEGDLENYINKKHKLAEPLVKIIMQHLALAMRYLREYDICHMDIKPKNILVQSKPRLTFKLSDFGIARVISSEDMDRWRDDGTLAYMAPEKIIGKPYDIRSDLWSAGIVMFQCLFGRPSYFQSALESIKTKMTNENLLSIPANAHISACCEDFLTRMLKYDPEERIQFDDFYNHPFLDLANVPTGSNYQAILKVAYEAVVLDNDKIYEAAFTKYKEAITLLAPYLQTETDPLQKRKLQAKDYEYKQRVNEICKLLNDAKYKDKDQPPDCSYEMLLKLSESTPKLVVGLEIGRVAEEYMAEGKYQLAFTKIHEALDVIMPLYPKEPQGHRKKLLLAQTDKWVKIGEELKKKLKTD